MNTLDSVTIGDYYTPQAKQAELHNSPARLEMEVIWYKFPEPFPESWEEVSPMPGPKLD